MNIKNINLGDIYTQMATNAYNMAFEIDKDNKIARNKLKLITELFNYKPNTNEKSIIVEELDAKIIKIEPRNKSVDKKKIIEKIAAWKTAWEAKDLDSYFDSYSENFKYPNQMSQEQWEKYRRDRIMNKKDITINISNIKTKFKKETRNIS